MEKEKHILKSMTDRVIKESKIGMEVQSITHQLSNGANRFEKLVKYANFLKRNLELGMFVECDKAGNVLEKPNCSYYDMTTGDHEKLLVFEEVSERVLFKGWKVIHTDKYRITIEKGHFQLDFNVQQKTFMPFCKIENLAQLEFELTEAGAREAGLI